MIRSDIHINCDMGESYGRYQLVDDEALMPYIDACNIACGYHAGDPIVIEQTIRLALVHGIQIGAHPSYPDRQGFGRRVMDIKEDELESMIRYQICAVQGIAQSMGTTLNHVKPHGALYNKAAKDNSTARAIVKAITSISTDLILYAPQNSVLNQIGKEAGLLVHHEAFIDRAYNEDGSLVSRKIENSVITDPSKAFLQVQSIKQKQIVPTIKGKLVPLDADTFCIHGDNSAALDILKHIKDELS